MKRILIVSALIIFLVISSVQAAEVIKASNWALAELTKANELGMISSYSKDVLQQPIDRKNFSYTALMALKNLYRVSPDFDYRTTYSDLYKASTHSAYIAQADHYGLIKGANDGRFYPNHFIRRRDAVVMLSRISKYFIRQQKELKSSPELTAFLQSEDYEKLPNYAKDAVCEFISQGLLKGMTDGKYHLDDNISAEAAIILAYRYMNHIKSLKNEVFSDEELSMIENFSKEEIARPIKKNIEAFKIFANIEKQTPLPAILSEDNYNNALNSMNRIRLAAGVPVVMRQKDLDYRAAYGALILFASNQFSHYPEQKNLPEEVYRIGKMGTSSSNLGMGYSNMNNFNFSCAYDNDASNYTQLGHRRWLINPNMFHTGFGMAGPYALTYALDEGRQPKVKPEALAYPSKTAFPFDYIKGAPFSIQFGNSHNGEEHPYKIDEKKNPIIELTRLNDKTRTIFSTIDLEADEEDRSLYNIDRMNFGYGPALIFRPPYEVKILDRYQVVIKGLIDTKTGRETSYEYEFILY